jgi:hypothetical protein
MAARRSLLNWMCERMLAEVGKLVSADDVANWVHKNLSAKNTLSDDDAKLVEALFR